MESNHHVVRWAPLPLGAELDAASFSSKDQATLAKAQQDPVVHCPGLQVAPTQATNRRPAHLQVVGSQFQEASRLWQSNLECSGLRKAKSWLTPITKRQVACICGSTSSWTRAQWLHPSPSTPWRSGHYFYEPLVSGGNLLGVWVLPEEYRKVSTEVDGKISVAYYVKVDNNPGSKPIPLQSRDYTASARTTCARSDVVRVVAVCSHPLQLEFHQRSTF
jgi:hypothetical protein